MILKTCLICHKEFRARKQRQKFCSLPCVFAVRGKWQKKRSVIWYKTQMGYIYGRVQDSDGSYRFIFQHRYFMEQKLGRRLKPTEAVHHINGVKDDNRLSNLELTTKSAHATGHNLVREYKRGFKQNLSKEERKSRSDRMRRSWQTGAIVPWNLGMSSKE